MPPSSTSATWCTRCASVQPSQARCGGRPACGGRGLPLLWAAAEGSEKRAVESVGGALQLLAQPAGARLGLDNRSPNGGRCLGLLQRRIIACFPTAQLQLPCCCRPTRWRAPPRSTASPPASTSTSSKWCAPLFVTFFSLCFSCQAVLGLLASCVRTGAVCLRLSAGRQRCACSCGARLWVQLQEASTPPARPAPPPPSCSSLPPTGPHRLLHAVGPQDAHVPVSWGRALRLPCLPAACAAPAVVQRQRRRAPPTRPNCNARCRYSVTSYYHQFKGGEETPPAVYLL